MKDTDEHGLDAYVQDLSKWIASRSSRRSIVGKVSRVFLGALGLELLPVFPADRRAYAQPGCTPTNCTDSRYCAMTGYPCESCSGGGHNHTNTCPMVMGPGGKSVSARCGAWYGCCPTAMGMRYIFYIDCCGSQARPANLVCDVYCCNQGHCVGVPDPPEEYCGVGTQDCPTANSHYWCTLIEISDTPC